MRRLNGMTLVTLVATLGSCGGSHRDAEDEAEDAQEAAEEAKKAELRQKIGIGKAAPHENCKEVGNIDGTGGGGGWTTSDTKMRDAQDELRAEAAQKGGNYVVMDATGSDLSGITITGRALACGDPPGLLVGTPPAGATSPAAEKSPEERLLQLKELHDKKLITTDEYERRRQEILKDL